MAQEESVPDTTSTALQGAVAGVIAGLVSRLVTFPADTLKARLQVVGALRNDCSNGSSASRHVKVPGGKPAIPQAAAVAQLLWRREGLSGFFRGFGAVAMGSVPGQAAYFGGYECGKLVIGNNHGMLGDMAVGCIAQLIAGVAFTPIDIIKERLQPLLGPVAGTWGSWMEMGVATGRELLDYIIFTFARLVQVQPLLQQQGMHAMPSSIMASVRDILHQSGPMGLLRGYWATNCVWLPWNIIYISMYEAEKRYAVEWLQVPQGQPLPPAATMACAFTAASVAAAATHPPDVIKTRLQVLSGQSGVPVTAMGLTKQLLQQEGPRALFSGLGARIAMMGPGAAVSWAVYEETKTWLQAQTW